MPPELKIQLLKARTKGRKPAKKQSPVITEDTEQTLHADADGMEVDSASADVEESVPIKEIENVLGPFIDLDHLWPPMPEKGSFDVSRTKNSPYFFS